MKSNLQPMRSCQTCKHCFTERLGVLYASESALLKGLYVAPMACYCNVEGECPAKTQQEFLEQGKGEYDPNGAMEKWLALANPDDPESSPRFSGFGQHCCDKWELSSEVRKAFGVD